MFASLLSLFGNWHFLLTSPFALALAVFWLWMFIHAVRNGEYLWALFIFIGWGISALLYFFLVYRQSGSSTQGFELPGAQSRRRIKELQAQIHHLDKAHHHSQLGDVYFSLGKLQKAEASYRAAMGRDAEDIDTRAHLGQCLLRQNRAAEAKPLLEGVVRQDPKHDHGHSMMALAETHMALGETDAAMPYLRYITENHCYPRARVQFAELLMARNEIQPARELLREVVEDDPHAPAFERKRDRVWVNRAKSLLSKIS